MDAGRARIVTIEQPTDSRAYWRCELPGRDHPVLFAGTRQQMEQLLDDFCFDYKYPTTGGRHMLILSRKRLESIILEIGGEEITVSVNRIHGRAVSLGIDAPACCKVRRSELKKEDDTDVAEH